MTQPSDLDPSVHDPGASDHISAIPAQTEFERKTAINKRVQERYCELMERGKHGHYETMFRAVHEERAEAIRDIYVALRDLVVICRYERLMPDDLSYMAQARVALAKANPSTDRRQTAQVEASNTDTSPKTETAEGR